MYFNSLTVVTGICKFKSDKTDRGSPVVSDYCNMFVNFFRHVACAICCAYSTKVKFNFDQLYLFQVSIGRQLPIKIEGASAFKKEANTQWS